MISDSKYNEYADKAVNSDLLSEEIFEHILENTFSVLTGHEEVHCESTVVINHSINT